MGVLELLEQSCRNFPQQIAIEWNNQRVTYAELDKRANQLANGLIASQLPKGSIIAVLLENRLDIIVSLIGILRAGNVFVPLDPEFPEQRLHQMLSKLSPDGFVTQTKWNKRIAHLLGNHSKRSWLFNIDSNSRFFEKLNNNLIAIKKPFKRFSTEKPKVSIDKEAACYIYHTSGSTGIPKGIVGRLNSLSHFIHWEIETFQITSKWRVSQFTQPTFDAFLRDVLVALATGSTICIPPDRYQLLDSSTLMDWIDEQRINLIHCVPSLFKVMVEGNLETQKLQSLKYILLAGEILPVSEVKKWMDIYHNRIQLVNLYGASETTMVKFFHLVQQSDIKRGFIPIGKPMKGAKALILDEAQEVCPPGIMGELYIRTPYMTLGYYQQPELTRNVFIKNPFKNDPRDLIYKTGDLARVLSDGTFQFLGRKDNQVKIRGIRIELGEIENVLLNHLLVKDAVLVFRGDTLGNQRLIAYIVVLTPNLSKTELQRFLKERLPEYMVPSMFVMLESLPLTANGKIDRGALPVPEQARQAPEETFVAPRNVLELQVSNLWQKVLGIQSPSIHDNFFDLGGHSLLAIKLLSRMEKTFGKRLPLISLFQAPTIAQQASILHDQNGIVPCRAVEIVQSQGAFPPLFFMGSTQLARALSPHLGKHQPIYGLNVFGFYPQDGRTILLDVKTLAKQCIQEMQTLQPQGPYYLGGYCGDAKTAFEIAQQLYANRQQVALLALFDAFLGLTVQGQKGYSLTHHRLNLLEFGPSYLFCKIRQRWQRSFTRTQIKLLSFLGKKLNRWHWTQKNLSSQFHYTSFINAYNQANANYVPQFYPGQITLFFASEWRFKDFTAFAKLATEMEIYEIPGYHDNLFDSPQVEVLGKQLRECLEKRLVP